MASRKPVIETAFRFSGYQGRDGGKIKNHTVIGPYRPLEVGVLKEAIKLLAIAFAAIRRHEGFPLDPERDAQLQVVIGLLALAHNEARALLLLCTMHMGIAARVHLRSLGEYATRANVYLGDQALAARVYRSVAASLKELVEDIALDKEVAAALDVALKASGEVKSDRKLVAGGTRGYVEKAKGGLTMTYMEFRSWSGPSHASVAAIREVALRTQQHENEIVLALATDGGERQWLWTGAAFVQSLVHSSLQVLGVTAPEVEKQYDLVAAELERLQRMPDAAVPPAPPKPTPSKKA